MVNLPPPGAATSPVAAIAPAAVVTAQSAGPEGTPADRPAVQVLDERTAPERLRHISTLILDCDGVLWRGSDIIRNAPEVWGLVRQGRPMSGQAIRATRTPCTASLNACFMSLRLPMTASALEWTCFDSRDAGLRVPTR
jgi:hypothetical protein